MTTRGMLEEDFVKVADLIHKGVEIAIDCKAKAEGPKLKDFNAYLEANARADVAALREEVEDERGTSRTRARDVLSWETRARSVANVFSESMTRLF